VDHHVRHLLCPVVHRDRRVRQDGCKFEFTFFSVQTSQKEINKNRDQFQIHFLRVSFKFNLHRRITIMDSCYSCSGDRYLGRKT
jgi:hypothetical protein